MLFRLLIVDEMVKRESGKTKILVFYLYLTFLPSPSVLLQSPEMFPMTVAKNFKVLLDDVFFLWPFIMMTVRVCHLQLLNFCQIKQVLSTDTGDLLVQALVVSLLGITLTV